MILAFKPIFVDKINKGIKIHTFREDSKDRWHPSREIQMATGVRTKNYNQFNEGICGGTQRIIIYATLVGCPTVVVDNRTLDPTETLQLIKNDGFDSLEDFNEWFNEDFDGKIIHWTHFKY